ncbi:hypothetical protein EDC04DRAFT_2907529 [Pisolithus marmoratus]|nr:hypothetical protein EDC04DRAFT_2907529 [Pisolithus marmoratus]
MSPVTRGMARKGIRHYAPYNLCSRGRNQTLLDLSNLPSTPRTPKATPWRMLTSSSILTFNRPYEMAYPLEAVGFGVKLRFIRDCIELMKAVSGEQKKTLRALEADEVVLQERLVIFEQGSLDYVERCADIAMDVMLDETMNNLLPADGTGVDLQYLNHRYG